MKCQMRVTDNGGALTAKCDLCDRPYRTKNPDPSTHHRDCAAYCEPALTHGTITCTRCGSPFDGTSLEALSPRLCDAPRGPGRRAILRRKCNCG